MPIITVEWLEGRTLQQKQAIAEAVTATVADIVQIRKEQVWVVFRDVKRTDWAMSGRLLAPPPA